MNERELDLAIAEICTAWRPRNLDGRFTAPAVWHDLDPNEREQAFDAASELRAMEAAMDADGLSTTARAVMALINREAGR